MYYMTSARALSDEFVVLCTGMAYTLAVDKEHADIECAAV